jgi:hypothetical protein
MAYLQKLLADKVSSNPFTRLRLQVISNSDLLQNLWLKLGQLPGIEEWLQMFTTVEMLNCKNSVGCQRCWKILNGYYDPGHKGAPDDAAEDSDTDTDEKFNKPKTTDLPAESQHEPNALSSESATLDTPKRSH